MATIYSSYPPVTVSIPAGGATAANQVLEIAQLTDINGKLPSALGSNLSSDSLSITFASDISGLPVTLAQLPASLGQTNMAGSLSVAIASDQSTLPISAASLPLPTGAATESTLSTLNGKIPSNLTVTSTRLLVDGSGVTQPISAASLPLPTGAATETTLASVDGKLPSTLGQKAMAASMAVVLASDQSAIPVTLSSTTITGTVAATQSGTWNINNISGTVSLPTGAATAAKQPALGTAGSASADVITVQGITSMTPLKVDNSANTQPENLTQIGGVSVLTGAGNTGTGSLRVTVASDQAAIATKSGGATIVNKSVNDYTSTAVTTSAYTQLIASTASAINAIEIFDSSGQYLVLATGGAGSEVDQLYIFPGGNGRIPFTIAASTRVSIKAVSATASVGVNLINYYA